jgi:general stress protein 26
MSDIKNLGNKEAVDKLKELAESAKMCLFTTALDQRPLSARPMSTQLVDERGGIWFFSPKSSNKNSDIEDDPHVQLFYSDTKSEYLVVYGTAEIVNDKER